MRDVAQITWALAVLAQPEPRYLEACQQAVARRMSQASVVDMINLMWAYAWLGTPPSAPCMQMHTVRVQLRLSDCFFLGCTLLSPPVLSAVKCLARRVNVQPFSLSKLQRTLDSQVRGLVSR